MIATRRSRSASIRGAGAAFCSGYDLSANNAVDQPYHSRGRPRTMVASCRRRLVPDLGSGQAGYRSGAWLLSGRRLGTGNRLRPGLCRRRRPDRLSAGAIDEPTRHAVSSVDDGDAPSHGIHADRRLAERTDKPPNKAGPIVPTRSNNSKAKLLQLPSESAKLPSELAAINKRSVHRGDGNHGPARSDSRRNRTAGTGIPDRGQQGLYDAIPARRAPASASC